ncbi:MAG: hypothetical protein ACPGJJ_01360, partial [Parvibaculales bacterium]
MRKVTVPEKFIRLAIVGALCLNVYGCGVSTGRDLTLAGAVQRFDDRRAAVRAEQAVLEGVDTKRAAQLKPLPPRRELFRDRPCLLKFVEALERLKSLGVAGLQEEGLLAVRHELALGAETIRFGLLLGVCADLLIQSPLDR